MCSALPLGSASQETRAACSFVMAWPRPFAQLSRHATNQPFCYLLGILNGPRPHGIPAWGEVMKTHGDDLPVTPTHLTLPSVSRDPGLYMLCVFHQPCGNWNVIGPTISQGSVALLEWVWPCWGSMSLGTGFDHSYAQDST